MKLTALTAISPIDGRYGNKLAHLRALTSEYALIKFRVYIEIQWFIALASHKHIKEIPKLNKKTEQQLLAIMNQFDVKQAAKVKALEKTTNHDIKAVEYYLKKCFQQIPALKPYQEFIHFGLTSEDVNNLSYALMLNQLVDELSLGIEKNIYHLSEKAKAFKTSSMLARTHGQAASPTTMGKEIANIVNRLQHQQEQLNRIDIKGKCNGAVGNFNALIIAYPDINWPGMAQQFVENLGLTYNPASTQIEPHDYIAELSNTIALTNTIHIDLCRDIWQYISMGYFTQTKKAGEVGSSTMPHKVNPIDFENAEGNFGLANALFKHFAEKLPISRLQRDLSDSTVLRNMGSAVAYTLLALQSLEKGIGKLQLNQDRLNEDLEQNWAVLAEPIQTVMRRYGCENPYEQLKKLTRGKDINQQVLHDFIDQLVLPRQVKDSLKALTPHNYTGLASKLVDDIV